MECVGARPQFLRFPPELCRGVPGSYPKTMGNNSDNSDATKIRLSYISGRGTTSEAVTMGKNGLWEPVGSHSP